MKTWPIAVSRGAARTLLAVPDRLGDGHAWRDLTAPSLEEVAGDGWAAAVLSILLPADRAWAWWTARQVLRDAQLPTARAAHDVALGDLDDTVRFRSSMWWRGMALAIVPPSAPVQRVVRDWAGRDSEVPEQVWTAPPGAARWNTDVIVAWCRSPERWSDSASIEEQPAGRLLLLFDGCIRCALPPEEAGAALEGLAALAARWGLSTVEAPAVHARLAPPG